MVVDTASIIELVSFIKMISICDFFFLSFILSSSFPFLTPVYCILSFLPSVTLLLSLLYTLSVISFT